MAKTKKQLNTYAATLRCVGRIMGLEQEIRFKSASLEDARIFADDYVYQNRDRFSRVLKVKAA
jgi:hypothetical protein